MSELELPDIASAVRWDEMKLLVVSGFLGAGKTTFIRALAKQTDRSLVVYENEFGESGIDARALERDRLSVTESTENCICCTGWADFANAVLTISNSLDPDILVVEPSGVAQLGSLLSTVERVCYERISLLPPVTLVDGRAFDAQRAAAPALWEDQVQNADILICSKTDNMLLEESGRLRSLLTDLNPTAEILMRDYGTMPNSWWERLLESPPSGTVSMRGEQKVPPARMEQLTVHHAVLPSPVHLFNLLDDMAQGQYGNILRSKGTFNCGGQRLRFDLVDGSWNVTGDEAAAEPVAVVIGKGLRRDALQRRIAASVVPSRKALHQRLSAKSRYSHLGRQISGQILG